MSPRFLSIVLTVLIVFAGVSSVPCHQGIPIDPSITEDSPREYSELYLERKDLKWTEIEEGIEFQEIRVGKGASPYKNSMAYVMWRMYDMEDGREIYYRTKHRTDNFYFGQFEGQALGGGGTLRAVELAMKGMQAGGKRLVTITSEKAFGKEGWSDSHFVVPPNMDVVIELSLLWVRDPDPKRRSPGEPHERPEGILDAGKGDVSSEVAEVETETSANKEEVIKAEE